MIRDARPGSRLTGKELARLRRTIRAALVSDALDALGLRRQCLGPGLRPLREGQVLVGHAFPVQVARVNTVPDRPYVGLLAALDAIGPDEVFLASASAGDEVAIWGELITNACMHRGAVGAVCNGFARDTTMLRQLDFPVFSRGTVPYDSNGRTEITGHGVPVQFEGVLVEPGDLIVGDDDGVVSVPRAVVREAIESALQKAQGENQFRSAVSAGMPATEAFVKYGVL